MLSHLCRNFLNQLEKNCLTPSAVLESEP